MEQKTLELELSYQDALLLLVGVGKKVKYWDNIKKRGWKGPSL